MKEIAFENKGKYTLVNISDFALTFKSEITIAGFHNDKMVYSIAGRRKKYYLPSAEELNKYMVFKGHNLPITVDTETHHFAGNALFNFVTDKPEELRAFLEANCLNPSTGNFRKVLYWPTKGMPDDGTPLFPKGEDDRP